MSVHRGALIKKVLIDTLFYSTVRLIIFILITHCKLIGI